MCSYLIQSGNEVTVRWVPAHVGVEGNEVADRFAKEAAEGLQHSVSDRLRWEASLSHLSRVTTEGRSKATVQWIKDHVRESRRYHPPAGKGFGRRALRRVRKTTAQRYYQLLTGHAAIGSFLHGKMTGPQRLDLDRCWWCNCGKRQTRHHLFTECRAWAPQVRALWSRVGKDCW